MNEKLPIPCERCHASGLFAGLECEECRGKGYRLSIDGRPGHIDGPEHRTMAPHAVGTIDRNMMDQRAVCSGGALDAIYRANDRPHVLAAVLITACKGAVEGVDDDPDDGQASGSGQCFGCGDDPVCIDLASMVEAGA